MTTQPSSPGESRRVLVRCPNWLGDTVMALPTIRALRAALPAAELLCLGPWVGSILEAEPGIARRVDLPRGVGPRLVLARALRREAIDCALLLPDSLESALFARVVGARWRVGYAGDGRAALLTHALRPSDALSHQVAAYLALLRPFGVTAAATTAPALSVSPARREEARRLLAEIGVRLTGPQSRWVGIQLGAAFGPSKLWSAERLAGLVTRLDREGLGTVLLGVPSAAPLLRAVEARLPRPVPSLVGRDHPALLPALLTALTVLVAPDSGPAHVAAAVGTPVVTLFGPTDPRVTAPLGDRVVALWRKPVCAPCFLPRCPIDHRCLDAITVDEVVNAVTCWLPRP